MPEPGFQITEGTGSRPSIIARNSNTSNSYHLYFEDLLTNT